MGERIANGWAIEGLNVIRVEKGMIRLVCDTNDSPFREGDQLALHQARESPKSANVLHVELQYDGETEIEISLIKGNPFFLAAEPRGWIADQDWFDASPFYLDALITVADSMRGRSTILPLLGGSLVSQMDYARYERAAQAAADNDCMASGGDGYPNLKARGTTPNIQGRITCTTSGATACPVKLP